MCFCNTIKPLVALALLVCLSCGSEEPSSTGNNWVAEPVGFDFSITDKDSVINLHYPITVDTVSVHSITVNNDTLGYRHLPGTITLRSSGVAPGKNRLRLIYTHKNITDTLEKEFVHSLKIAYTLVKSYKHNSSYFTQGLLFDDRGNLIESTGLEGSSKIIFYRPATGGFIPTDSVINENNEFGEGITIYKSFLVQLFWKNNYLRLYDLATRKPVKKMPYQEEGWGICTDGENLYASNGTGAINVLDISGDKAHVINILPVAGQHGPVTHLNELEYIGGLIFANVWQTNFIYVIDPATGAVVGELDLSAIAQQEKQQLADADVLNGIAYNTKNNTLLITGKRWGNFYELKPGPLDLLKNKPSGKKVEDALSQL